jgi:hypothetical protein
LDEREDLISEGIVPKRAVSLHDRAGLVDGFYE